MNRREKEEAFAYGGEFGCLLHKAKWQQHASKGAEARLSCLSCMWHVAWQVPQNVKRNLLFCKLIQFQFERTNASIGLTNSQIQMHLILISFATLINFRLQII